MYSTLAQAMDARNVTQREIASLIGCHYNTVNAKMQRKNGSDFAWHETKKIHRKWFSDLPLEELFAESPTAPAPPDDDDENWLQE